MVCKCCDHCRETLHEELVGALEQVNIWREKEVYSYIHYIHRVYCNTHDHPSSYGGRKVGGGGEGMRVTGGWE